MYQFALRSVYAPRRGIQDKKVFLVFAFVKSIKIAVLKKEAIQTTIITAAVCTVSVWNPINLIQIILTVRIIVLTTVIRTEINSVSE